MKCPSCGAQAGDDAAECPACGLIFAKWRERQAKEKSEALLALAKLEEEPKAAPRDPWIGRGIALAVVVAWLLGFSVYMVRHTRAQRHAPIGEDTGTFVEMRDPKTGDMRRMPIRRPRRAGRTVDRPYGVVGLFRAMTAERPSVRYA